MSSTRPVTFGSRQSGAAGYDLQFRGFMQETAIYNFALTPAQVLTHYSLAANRGPVFNQNPITFADVNAGQNFSASVATNATDPNGDALTFAKVSGPNWLNVSASGALSGTPADADAGTNAFVLSVRDPSSVTTTANAYIYVNGTPSFSQKPINLAPVAPNVAYSASLTNYASDPNPGDVLSFAKLTGPAWLSLAGDGTLSGLPADSDAGTNSFTVQVTDAAGLSDSTTLNIPIIAAPTFKAGITFQNGMIVIDWPAGSGTFIIQSATNLTNPVWETIAGPTTDTTLTLAPTNDAAFFRVLAQ